MSSLTETHTIEILLIVGYGDRSRTLQDCNLFNLNYLITPISQSIASKICFKY